MLKIYEAYQGKNRCFAKARLITGVCAPLVHDTGCNQTHAGRYVECPEFLEGTSYKNKYKNYWNSIVPSKMVHAFIGLDADEEMCVALSLPLQYCCWGVGGGKNGSYNYPATKAKPKQFAHIQPEVCEDGKKDDNYYELAMNTAAEWFAWLIQQGYCSDDMSLITCHRDAARAGFGSNHSDIYDWSQYHDETTSTYMDSFRSRVQKYLDAGEVQVEWKYGSYMNACKQSTKYNSTARYLQTCLNRLGYECETDGLLWNQTLSQLKQFQSDWNLTVTGICDAATWAALMSAMNGKTPPKPQEIQHFTGTVKTASAGYISLWKDIKKSERVIKIIDGKIVEVVGNCESGTLAPAKYNSYSGYVDTQYLKDRTYIYDDDFETDTGDDSEGTKTSNHFTGKIKTSTSGYVSLWEEVSKKNRVCKILDGETVEVTSDCISGTMAPAKYKDYVGFVNTKYVVDKSYIYDEEISDKVVEEPEENNEDATQEDIVQHFEGIVETAHSGYISLWKNVLKTSRICKVPDGETVEVTSDCISGTMAPAKYGIYNGYADIKYLVNRKNL